MRYINTLHEGETIRTIYLCKGKRSAETRNGKPYDNLILQDKTGTLDGKVWDPNSNGIADYDEKDFVEVFGEVINYNGNLQLNIRQLRVAGKGEYNPADYMPTSEKSVDGMYEELMRYGAQVKNSYLQQVIQYYFVKDEAFIRRFKSHSAAKTVHHGFAGGLLEHTLSVVKMCEYMVGAYPILNKDLLYTAAMCHDIGKTQELTLDQQFEIGIRVFDLRPAVKKNDLKLCHGIVETTFAWDQVMERFKYYLSEHPGEFIIALIRHEDEADNKNSSWGSIMQTKLESLKAETNPKTNESYTADFKPDLTVGELRGKILFLCRDWTKYNNDGPVVGGYTGWSHSPSGSEVSIYSRTVTGTMNIQDCYSPSEDGQSKWYDTGKFPEIKWNGIKTLLDKSMSFHTNPEMVNRWSVNHTSGYVGWASTTNGYRENAANNNIKLYNYINSTTWCGSTGIVLMDFVGAHTSGSYTVYGDLCPQAIIDNNYKYRMRRKGE